MHSEDYNKKNLSIGTHFLKLKPEFEIITDQNGRESIRIKDGKKIMLIAIGAADLYRRYPLDDKFIIEGYTVIGYDPPGERGESGTLVDENGNRLLHTMEAYADFDYKLICELVGGEQNIQHNPINILAMSMAGIPMEIIVGRHPEIINKLILAGTFATLHDTDVVKKYEEIWATKAGTFPKIDEVTELNKFKAKLIEIFAGDNWTQSIETSLKEILSSTPTSAEEIRIAQGLLPFISKLTKGKAVTMTESFIDILFNADVRDYCRFIPGDKVMVIGGRNDDLATPQRGKKIGRFS